MGIILKFLLRNIKEKKLRSLLILVSISLSSALYFGTVGMSTTIQDMYGRRLRQYFGSAEILIHAKEGSPSNFFSPLKARGLESRLDYAVGMIRSGADFLAEKEDVRFDLIAVKYSDLDRMNPASFKETSGLLPFSGKKMILGEQAADRYGLSVGDSLRVEINGGLHRFRLCGIARSTGFFTDDGSSVAAIVPLEVLSSIFDVRGRVSLLYIKTRHDAEIPELMKELEDVYPRYHVRETVTREQIQEWSESITVPFKVMLVLVLAISVFIIFTSFQVITFERLPVIGTFRSLGATKRTTDLVLFGESLIYGILGGVFGCLLGIGVIYAMVRLNSGDWLQDVSTIVRFTPGQLLTSFLLAVGLSCGSSTVPIIRTSRIPVKEIILGLYRRTAGRNSWKSLLGVLFIAVGMTVPFIVPRQMALVVDTACIVMTLIGTVMLVPLVTGLCVKLFEKVNALVFGNIGVLAAKNMKNSRTVQNNTALLAIGISGLFMINTINHSVMVSVTQLYREARFDIMMSSWGMDRNFEQRVRTVPGVEETYGIYNQWNTKVADSEEEITFIQGIQAGRYPEYWDYRFSGNRAELLEELDRDRNIILTVDLKKRLEADVGDTVILELSGRDKEYRVIGFFSALMMDGDYALVSERFLKQDARLRYYGDIYIKTDDDPDDVEDGLREKFRRRRPWIMTMEQMEKNNVQSNKDLFLILRGFSIMAMLIGIIGIVNNFLISYLERKRTLALFRATGMSRGQTVGMIFVEALGGGIIGVILGLITGVLILYVVPHLLFAMDVPVVIIYSFLVVLNLFLAGIGITLLASVSPAFKSSRLNVIEAINYE